MIKTKHGRTRAKGSKGELIADIICIMLSLEENIPGFANECVDFMRKAEALEDMDDATDS